jgi:cytochrome c biogenesis protein ResB
MNFGIPKKRRRKVEFHSELPVMRVLAVVDGKNSRKFVFNTKAAEMLGFGEEMDEKVSLSFEDGLYVANTTTLETEQYRVTTNKPYSFSNKKVHGYLVENGLDTTVNTDYVLTAMAKAEGQTYTVAELSELVDGGNHDIDAEIGEQIRKDEAIANSTYSMGTESGDGKEEEEELPELLAVEENHTPDTEEDSSQDSPSW